MLLYIFFGLLFCLLLIFFWQTVGEPLLRALAWTGIGIVFFIKTLGTPWFSWVLAFFLTVLQALFLFQAKGKSTLEAVRHTLLFVLTASFIAIACPFALGLTLHHTRGYLSTETLFVFMLFAYLFFSFLWQFVSRSVIIAATGGIVVTICLALTAFFLSNVEFFSLR